MLRLYRPFKSKRNRRTTGCWFLLLLQCTLGAEASALTLDDLIQAALRNNPELETLRINVDTAHAKAANVPWWDAPELRAGYGRDTDVSSTRRTSDYPNHQYEMALRMFPKNPWERNATQKQLQSNYRLKQLALDAAKSALKHQIRLLHCDLSYLIAERDLHKQVVDVFAMQSESAQKLLRSGQISLGQSLAVQVKQLDQIRDLEKFDRDINEIKAQLAKLAGKEIETLITHRPIQLSSSSFDWRIDEWEKLALSQRIDLQEYKEAILSTQSELKAVKARDIPWIRHVQANYEVSNDFGDRDQAGIQLAINLPFFAQDDGEREAIETTLVRQQNQQILASNQIRLEVKHLIDQFVALEESWNTYAQQIKPLTEELKVSILRMEEQNAQVDAHYWEARSTLLELSKKEIQTAHQYHRLSIKAAHLLGDDQILTANASPQTKHTPPTRP